MRAKRLYLRPSYLTGLDWIGLLNQSIIAKTTVLDERDFIIRVLYKTYYELMYALDKSGVFVYFMY